MSGLLVFPNLTATDADPHLTCGRPCLVRQGLKTLLDKQGFQVVCEAADGQAAVRVGTTEKPGVAILDLSIPLMNGIEAPREMVKSSAKTRVILLPKYDEDPYVVEALRAGVKGYVLKSQASNDLVHAIPQVSRGQVYLSPSISRVVVEAYLAKTLLPDGPLSGRGRQVLQLVGEGKTTKEVAQQLGTSVKTAESHRTNIMKKLDIHETASLVRYAIRRGLIRA